MSWKIIISESSGGRDYSVIKGWQNEDFDIIYIHEVDGEYKVVYFPWHGLGKTLYNGKDKELAWKRAKDAMDNYNNRIKRWIRNKGNDRMDVEESKIAEKRER